MYIVWSGDAPRSSGTKLFRPLNRFRRLHLPDALRLGQPRSACSSRVPDLELIQSQGRDELRVLENKGNFNALNFPKPHEVPRSFDKAKVVSGIRAGRPFVRPLEIETGFGVSQ